MKVEFLDNSEISDDNSKQVQTDTKVKEFLVNHVGDLKDPTDGNVTVDMIIDVVASEFPEFVMALAEENWIRGYQQALTDVSVGEKLNREDVSGS